MNHLNIQILQNRIYKKKKRNNNQFLIHSFNFNIKFLRKIKMKIYMKYNKNIIIIIYIINSKY